ncbi:cysteine-tryptophan domain-containing zinc finger protein 5-like isoform X3 [Lycium ferocissimum]|uniref:cysteine-tryptophan domain-containing zinc finger protein 5-like isoform X3 n=1 Tax=Lycium ferocissimum TaxID=112874 RepID=UPI0028162303|nr:cysteine-tryptophan domain-containing zinc finger protein 5-like isoform X3 [Lycium ferocissimum]
MSKLFRVKEEQREQAENANGKPPVKKQSAGVNSDVASATPMKDPSAVGIQSSKELTSGAEPPVDIQEDWVACDKCQKWRLLPYGTEIEQLPNRWLCSMLNWLPGMNHCNISEEETTRALHQLNSLQVDSDVACATPMKDPSAVGIQSAKELTSGAKPPVAPVSIIEEDWIACDICQQWRLLPYGTEIKQLPERWLCSMSNWLPGMNHCDISEDETTRAMHVLNSLRKNAATSGAGVISADRHAYRRKEETLVIN